MDAFAGGVGLGDEFRGEFVVNFRTRLANEIGRVRLRFFFRGAVPFERLFGFVGEFSALCVPARGGWIEGTWFGLLN